MPKAKRILQFSTIAMAIIGATAPPLCANVVTFSFTGTAITGPGSWSGTGSFSYNDTPSTITLADLTMFQFHMVVNGLGGLITPTFTYGTGSNGALLPLSFTATANGPFITSLSLQTDFEFADNSDSFQGERLTVSSLGANGASIQIQNPLTSAISEAAVGTVTITSPLATPEPATGLVTGAALLLAASLRRMSAARNG